MKFLKASLGIKKGETVLIVTDDGKQKIAQAIETAAKKLSNEVLTLKMAPRSQHAEEPPEAVAEAMKRADVVIIPTTKSLSHTDARTEACKAGARVASMPGVTQQMFRKGGLTADYTKVKSISEGVAKRLTRAKEIRIKTKAGCDFTASLTGRKGLADTGILKKKGDFGNLPAGEGFIAPNEKKSEGVLVFDGSFAGLGVLTKPIKVTITKGKAVKIEGDRGKLKKMLTNGDNIAEVGIGTNPKAKLIGNVLEDEKVMGTIHVAFGDNHTFGGKIKANVHLDGIIKRPDIYLDGRKIMENGSFVSSAA
ncbi:aminopeptidase [archaeon]|nr:aminopeptidase [archaeon]